MQEKEGSFQAWCQNSVTGGGRNKFWGGTMSLFTWIREGQGAQEIYSGVNQTSKVKTKDKKNKKRSSVQKYPLIMVIVCDFSQNAEVKTKKKVFVPKVVWSSVWVDKNYKIASGKHQFGSPRPWFALPIAQSLLISSGNSPCLGGYNFCLGEHKQSFGLARPRNAPRGIGPGLFIDKGCMSCWKKTSERASLLRNL